ncbi:MAG: competence/damage-inducible protein A [Halomonadaceae bacterium]|nr:MAG: competence/damage-inducible protein A [Halomonadaceae bacterium]
MQQSDKPHFGIILIGDELLNGRKQDGHLAAVIERFAVRGLELNWVRMIGDDPQLLTATLAQTFASNDIVLSFGGIGATPDDRTRQCAAGALGVEIALHPEAEAEIRNVFNNQVTPQRLRMGEFPVGSRIIPNPINRIAGFSIHRHHFVPGFPRMAWPMVEWVLDNEYPHLLAPGSVVQENLLLVNTSEGPLIPLMEELLASYPDLTLACLPNADGKREVELSLKGTPARVELGMAMLRQELQALFPGMLEEQGAGIMTIATGAARV